MHMQKHDKLILNSISGDCCFLLPIPCISYSCSYSTAVPLFSSSFSSSSTTSSSSSASPPLLLFLCSPPPLQFLSSPLLPPPPPPLPPPLQFLFHSSSFSPPASSDLQGVCDSTNMCHFIESVSRRHLYEHAVHVQALLVCSFTGLPTQGWAGAYTALQAQWSNGVYGPL